MQKGKKRIHCTHTVGDGRPAKGDTLFGAAELVRDHYAT
jgi:hypothetical protein